MKHPTLLWLAAFFCCAAHAQVGSPIPPLVSYQGRVVVGTTNFDGNGQFRFALVDGGVNLNVRATASAMGGGQVVFIGVNIGGSGYVSAPAVTITDPTGTGATAVATVSNGSVTSIQITNGGSGYSFNPTVTIAPPPPNIVTTTFWRNSADANSDGQPDTAVSLTVTKGLYSVLLGDASAPNMLAIPTTVFTNPDLRLRVWFDDGVNGSQLLTPDQRLTPTAYLAAGAVQSTSIADGAIVSSKISPGAITGTQLATGSVDATRISTAGAPATGQVLTYGTNGMTWSVPGNNVFSLNGSSAFYNGGNVGLGTNTPSTKLELRTGLDYGFTHTNGTITLRTFIGNTSNSPSGGWFGTQTNFPLYLYANNGEPSITVSTAGKVGVGTVSPQEKLHVQGSGPTETTIRSSNERAMLSLEANISGAARTYTLESGVNGVSGLFGIYDRTAGQVRLAIDAGGNVGVGTTSPFARLHATSTGSIALYGSATSGTGVSGYTSSGTGVDAYSNSGTGVYASTSAGRAIYANGNVGQSLQNGGFVKAMIRFESDGTITHAFNSFLNGNAAISAPCGFTVQVQSGLISPGYVIDFGFAVVNRFVNVTPSPSAVRYGQDQFGTSYPNKLYLSSSPSPYTVIVY